MLDSEKQFWFDCFKKLKKRGSNLTMKKKDFLFVNCSFDALFEKIAYGIF